MNHLAACYDEDGKLECVCELADRPEPQAWDVPLPLDPEEYTMGRSTHWDADRD